MCRYTRCFFFACNRNGKYLCNDHFNALNTWQRANWHVLPHDLRIEAVKRLETRGDPQRDLFD